jgi:hypothetical protein
MHSTHLGDGSSLFSESYFNYVNIQPKNNAAIWMKAVYCKRFVNTIVIPSSVFANLKNMVYDICQKTIDINHSGGECASLRQINFEGICARNNEKYCSDFINVTPCVPIDSLQHRHYHRVRRRDKPGRPPSGYPEPDS